MKTYIGIRFNGHGQILVQSGESGTYLSHPRGDEGEFDWGYRGIGPTETATVILTDFLRPADEAGVGGLIETVSPELSRRFGDEIVARLPRGRYLRGMQEEWRLKEDEIRRWLDGSGIMPAERRSPGEAPQVAPASAAWESTARVSQSRRHFSPKRRVSLSAWGVASLISGALALVLLPNLFGPLAIILGAAALGRKERQAVAGVVLGAATTAFVLGRAIRSASAAPSTLVLLGLPAVVVLILTLAVGAYLGMSYLERRKSGQASTGAQPPSGG